MHNNKKNEELQTRREFFKKTAKRVLPVLGAALLAGSPILSKAADATEKATGCYGCEGGCWSCTGTCNGMCKGCSGSCSGTCLSSCRGNCYQSCTYR